MTFAAITTLPKTTSTLNMGETSSNYTVTLWLSPHKSSHGTFLDSVTVDLFKILDVNQQLKRRNLRNQHEFPSCLIDFNPRTYFVRPKTCYCQQQSSQYPMFPSQARDQSFTRVARNETKYQKIVDAADVRIVPS